VPVPFSGTYDPHVFPCGTPLNHFTVLPGQVRSLFQVSATIATNDLTVTLLYREPVNPVPVAGPEDTGTFVGTFALPARRLIPLVIIGPGLRDAEPGAVPQVAPFDYNGTFTTDNTAPAGGAPPPKTLSVAPAPLDNGAKIGFENFAAPACWFKVKTTEVVRTNGVESWDVSQWFLTLTNTPGRRNFRSRFSRRCPVGPEPRSMS